MGCGLDANQKVPRTRPRMQAVSPQGSLGWRSCARRLDIPTHLASPASNLDQAGADYGSARAQVGTWTWGVPVPTTLQVGDGARHPGRPAWGLAALTAPPHRQRGWQCLGCTRPQRKKHQGCAPVGSGCSWPRPDWRHTWHR